MVERRGAPQVVERRGVPQVVEMRGVPQVVKRRGVPQVVEMRGAPQVVERKGVLQVVKRKVVPQVVERRGVLQVVERRAQKSPYRTVHMCLLISMWGQVDSQSPVLLSVVTVPCCQPPNVGRLSPARGPGRLASSPLWTRR